MLESDKSVAEQKKKVDELRKLFQETQALPQAKAICDEMIAEEIEKARSK